MGLLGGTPETYHSAGIRRGTATSNFHETRDNLLRDLMARMGHDSPAAALIYQHSSRAADEAIAVALDARLVARVVEVEKQPRNVSGARMGPADDCTADVQEVNRL